ncbi:MAG: tRNA (adenosine(37)-N6)-threonylcarbamoyltransferase complex dimerization subunit type 1 TsaB [Solirubrobacteraceae bacterium]
MIVLGFDTATRATAVALRLADGSTLQARDDPAPDERPGHATRLLEMARGLLADAGIGWSALERVAVGRGPGTFTGLRVGVATARGLAQSLGVELVGVSSLRALAEGARGAGRGEEPAPAGGRTGILAVLDARRGEAFAAAYLPAGEGAVEELLSPSVSVPEQLGSIVAQAKARAAEEQGGRWLAVGDGAVRFRGELEAAGVAVPADASPAHLLSAEAICELGALAPAGALGEQAILPEYGRRPDAEIALDREMGGS